MCEKDRIIGRMMPFIEMEDAGKMGKRALGRKASVYFKIC